MNINAVRLQLERKIEEIGSNIDVAKPKAQWLRDESWMNFLKAWRKLVIYYAEQGDVDIGPFALSMYVDFTRLIKRQIDSGDLDSEWQDRAKEELESLESYMDEILKETMTNLEYHLSQKE